MSTSEDGNVLLWDVDARATIKRFDGQRPGLDSIAVTPEAGLFALVNVDGSVVIRDAEQGARVSTDTLRQVDLPRLRTEQVTALTLSRDGSVLASGIREYLQLWDTSSGRELVQFASFVDEIRCLAFSADGELLAVGSRDNSVRLYEVHTGREMRTLKGHSGPVLGIIFTHEGKELITVSSDQSMLVWNVGQLLNAPPHTYLPYLPSQAVDRVNSMAFLPTSKTLVAVVEEGLAVQCVDTESGRLLRSIEVESPCNTLAVSVKGQLAFGHANGTVTLWDSMEGQRSAELAAHSEAVRAVAFSRDGTRFASGGEDDLVKVWDADNGALLATLTGHESTVRALVFCADARTLASGDLNGSVVLWDVDSRQSRRLPQSHRAAVLALAVSPDGTTLATASWDYSIKLWNVSNLKLPPATLIGHSAWVSSVWFSADGKTLFSAGGDRMVKMWNVTTLSSKGGGRRAERGVYSLALSSDERVLAVSHGVGIQFWRAASPEEVEVARESSSSDSFAKERLREAGAYSGRRRP